MIRTILHCDMNNFYASVECMLNPSLRGRPVAVCGETEDRHGIVLAKNYEAKAYGIITGEPVVKARQKCPDLAVVPPHYETYLEISRRAKAIYDSFTDLVEPFGLDECWLDVTGSRRLFGSGETIAHTIRRRIKAELGVTASVGVSFNKVFAKLGSDMKKPNAVTVIPPDSFREVIWHLPASDLLGAVLGIHTIGELARYPLGCLKAKFGKCGEELWRFANGLDTSAVVSRDPEFLDKTAGHGITTLKDLVSPEEVWPVMLELSQNVGHRLHVYGKSATGVAIAVRDNRLFSQQWQCKLPYPTRSPSRVAEEAFRLFEKSYSWRHPIRSVTVRAIGLIPSDMPYQLDLFTDVARVEKRERLDRTVEALRERYGDRIIRQAVLLHNPKMPGEDVLRRIV
jgi:DNA polymerase-4